MIMDQASRQADHPESKIISNPEQQEKDARPFDAGRIWMSMAAGSQGSCDKNTGKCVPGLPDIDLDSGKDADGKKIVLEGLIDDIDTVLRNNGNGKVSVHNHKVASLSKDKSGDLPLIKCSDVPAGRIGLLMSTNADGHTYYTPFIAASVNPRTDNGDTGALTINENAAKELHIDGDLKRGRKVKVDVVTFPDESLKPPFPRSTSELDKAMLDKLHVMAEDIRDQQAREFAAAQAEMPEPPPPDPVFGYKRTERGAEELTKIAENYRTLARESQKQAESVGIEDRMKAFGKQAQADIDKYQKEIDKHGKGTDNALETSKYNLSYAQSELAISKNKDAFARHMRARASAAAVLSMNPDMEGALTGHRIVINSGHYPGDPKFPGFSKDGIPEWKINMECQDVFGAMVKMTGGAVKLVNQEDLKDKTMTGLTNALKAAKAEAAISIHHDDGEKPDLPAMRGTLTLHCAKTTGDGSLQLAEAVHMAKLNYAGLYEKVNANGVPVGIREQCGRGIQGHKIGAPFILDEEGSTHKDEWPRVRDPKTNAEVQFAHVAALYELLSGKPRYKTSANEAKLYQEQVWNKTDMDDIFTARPKVGSW
jgi:hypothetical protein